MEEPRGETSNDRAGGNTDELSVPRTNPFPGVMCLMNKFLGFLVLGNFVALMAFFTLTILEADRIAVNAVLALMLSLVIGSTLIGIALKSDDLE